MITSVIVIFVSILCLGLAYYLNPENAKSLLAGYNTMSDTERDNFDIVNYLKFFKSFFIKLSIYSILIFVFIYFLYDEETAAIVWTISLMVPWPYYIIKSKKYSK